MHPVARARSSVRNLGALLLYLAVASHPALANPGSVELNYRLQPDRDQLAETVTESVVTMRVLEDRGIVAKTQGRLSARPVTLQTTGRQSFRYLNGIVQPDGSFQSEMRYLDKSTVVRGADGQAHALPEKVSLKGARISATVERDGQIRAGSVALDGVDAQHADALRSMLANVLAQAASIQPITLTPDQSVPQDVTLQLPVPGVTTLDMKLQISNRLLGVNDGVANIQQIFTMTFGAPAGPLKMAADGSGGGTLLYELATKTLRSSDTGMLMKLTLDTPEGVLELKLNSRTLQTTRPTPAETR
jgi:hypothetical protein